MDFRRATDEDLDLLADWNRQLIEDEGHRNAMEVELLRARMAGWLGMGQEEILLIDRISRILQDLQIWREGLNKRWAGMVDFFRIREDGQSEPGTGEKKSQWNFGMPRTRTWTCWRNGTGS